MKRFLFSCNKSSRRGWRGNGNNAAKTGNFASNVFSRYILRPHPQASSLPVCLRSVGHARVGANQTAALWRSIDFVQLIWTVAGEGTVEFGDHRHVIKNGQVVCYLPGMKFELTAGVKGWEYRWLTFDGSLAPLIVKFLRLPLSPAAIGPCPVKLFSSFERGIRRIEPAGERQLGVQAYSFLSDVSVMAHSRNSSSSPDKTTLGLLQALVDSIQDKEVGIEQIADDAQISRSTLGRRIKEAMGVSPKQYVNTVRLQRALALLKESDLSVSEVAVQCGFANANYMAKFIRKNTGKNPTRLRAYP